MAGHEPHASEKYVPLLELGRGGMAVVYLSVVRGAGGFQKLQVIKRLRRDVVAEAPELLDMFLDEARIAARINHPNVVQTNEIGEDVANHYIAMEYLEGQALSTVTREAKDAFTLPLHLRVLCDVLAGLHHAHELKDFDGAPLDIVHRDVSPHNVIVTYTGIAKLVDFGIAKAADSHLETRSGVVKGKYPYMAPEQFLGGGVPVDRRADVYAVGVLLWQALTGRRLWPRGTEEMEIVVRASSGNIPRPSEIDPTVPTELEEICMKALAPSRAERWATAAEMQAAIERVVDKLEPHPRSADVGAFMTEFFAKERETLERAIRARISEQTRASIPVPHVTSILPTASISSSSLEGEALRAKAIVDDGAETRSLASTISKPSIPAARRTRSLGLPVAAALAVIAAFFIGRGALSSPKPEPSHALASSATPPSSVVEPAHAVESAAALAVAAAPPDASAASPAVPLAAPATPAVIRTAQPIAPKPSPVAPAAPSEPAKQRPKVDETDPWMQK